LPPGPVVSGIIQIIPVDDMKKSAVRRHCLKLGIQFVLAEVTPVRRVFDIVLVGHLAGRNEFMSKAVSTNQIHGNVSLVGWIARTFGCDGQGVAAKFLVRNDGKVRTIDAPAESDDTRPHFTENSP
jgi:hypothetical protein